MRLVAGCLLVGAALLKAAELVTEPAAALFNPLGRYLLPAQIGVELAIGLVILSGLYWHTLRWFVLVLFTGFAGYSLYLALSGAASCGCFGPVHINPWWTFCLDSAIMLGVLVAAMREQGQERINPGAVQFPYGIASHKQLIVVAVGIVGMCAPMLLRYVDQETAVAGELFASVGNLVILEPGRWVGQKLPIADSVDADLSRGDWTVLLHRHDCAVCQAQVPRYVERAVAGEQVALVEVPPYGDSVENGIKCVSAKLRETHEWFVQTPVEIRLVDGVVKAVKTHDH